MIYIVLAIILLVMGGFVAMLLKTYPISKWVYTDKLVKTSEDKWLRVCSAPENEEQLAMWNSGIEWAEKNTEFVKEVSVESEGLKLYGEYYDYGSDKCAIIVPGRCECLKYSYYFAKPYQEAGMNILVIDSRAHGFSEGKYSTIGVHESRDLIEWMKLLKNDFNVKSIWLHGICIGSAAALMATSDEYGKNVVTGVVLEGCFTDFRESFKQHMKVDKRPVFPVLDLVMFQIYKHTKVNVVKQSPYNVVDKIKCPILFLFGKRDLFSIPPKSKKLFEKCGSEKKKLVWFYEGCHSHLRINNLEKYDESIKEFVKEYDK